MQNDLDTKIIVDQAIDKLPDKIGGVVKLKLIGYNAKEIGKMMGVSEEYVRIMFETGKRGMRKYLSIKDLNSW